MYRSLLVLIICCNVTTGQENNIVSLTTGNIWLYEVLNKKSNGEVKNTYFFTREVIRDTVVNGKESKVINKKYFGNDRVNEESIVYTDTQIYGSYNSDSEFYMEYDNSITNDTLISFTTEMTMGDVIKRIRVESVFLFDDYYKVLTHLSSTSRSSGWSKYSEKFGYIGSGYGSFNSSSETVLIGAIIDNVSYGFTKIDEAMESNSIIVNQNYPNPFNSSTTISFFLKEDMRYEINVTNILGEQVFSHKSAGNPGYYEVPIDLSEFASGIYIYVLNSEKGHSRAKKMLYIK